MATITHVLLTCLMLTFKIGDILTNQTCELDLNIYVINKNIYY